jgi:phosphatidate cytidylyltransferase
MTGILMALVCVNHLFDKFILVGAFLPLLALLDFKRYPQKVAIGKHSLGIGYLLGWVLLLPFFSSLTYLLFFEVFGKEWLLVGIAIVCLSDSGAYFMGRWIGKHKLAPHISPGKTWEGVLGAFLAPTLALGIASLFHWSGAGVSLFHWFIISLILVPVGILGDLYESYYKRSSGLKDSGSLLPGHGGILDRLDALLFAIPCFVLLLKVFLT